MHDQEQADKMLALAMKTGRAFAATDVYDALVDQFAKVGVTLIKSEYLERGTIVAIEEPKLPTMIDVQATP